MASLTDDLMGKLPENTKKGADTLVKTGQKIVKGTEKMSDDIKGLAVILLKGLDYSVENVMNAVRDVVYKTSRNLQYSSYNISIEQLRKSGKVFKVDDMISSDVMKYFDKHCRKMGIKYSAMKDCRDDKPSYILFFQGNDSDLILQAMQNGCRDYEKEKTTGLNKELQINPKQEQRESVKAKLAFFRDRVAARDKDRGAVEKNRDHSEMSR